MKSPRPGWTLCGAAAVACALATACSPTFVVVPTPEVGYTAADTLRGRLDGNEVRVTFRQDTVTRVRTVTRWDTVWVEREAPAARDTVVRVDTVLVAAPGTPPGPGARARPQAAQGEQAARVDTVRLTVTDTLLRVDTVRVVVTDTVRVPGRRLLFVPPGHYPPEGLCRVWVHGLQPGQQARATACDALPRVPAGAFVLFRGDAWDIDYDWVAEAAARPGTVPPEIVAVRRRQG